ncbi:DUF6046 domain-containing protein [Tenacibaculum finnmarkense]|uniref:DUF6046 domain-containing protein n=1 Tax=Tenacibaculum finnmarkense TaxID=2781243 RepID=UPI000C378611|nr:DUF6046 domain-containing protein [Tenacibaculum finnmarkense]MBE7687410.1 hypothetical protein [Tenacibaculum finnmarkense genomovar ulcerans]MCD8412737.1 DUF6046 domain-containing protein [Tenacibaculum finnmarkense genomovar ulcerans]MCD8428874.1 DUF6046 domain-containing protein [Tenacibaculum finnmarkense genomovar ulcerans]MCG8235762.1 hypothetical protein [Tenacibaculum finnmarkense genomovar ulcerans]MCG8829904.1 hypothetical protein [Tenacibaculum finnmarkense]
MNNGEAIVINLAARYAAAFGAVAISKLLNKAILIKEDNKYDVEFYNDACSDAENITFKYAGEELLFGEMLTGKNTNTYAPPLMVSFSREKNLIETEASGSDSVVVERWGTKPWSIDIRGILIDVDNREYPSYKIDLLARFFEHNDIIEVYGEQFYDKDIDSIYLTAISITPVEGFADTVQISLSAKSIKGVNYTLLNPM